MDAGQLSKGAPSQHRSPHACAGELGPERSVFKGSLDESVEMRGGNTEGGEMLVAFGEVSAQLAGAFEIGFLAVGACACEQGLGVGDDVFHLCDHRLESTGLLFGKGVNLSDGLGGVAFFAAGCQYKAVGAQFPRKGLCGAIHLKAKGGSGQDNGRIEATGAPVKDAFQSRCMALQGVRRAGGMGQGCGRLDESYAQGGTGNRVRFLVGSSSESRRESRWEQVVGRADRPTPRLLEAWLGLPERVNGSKKGRGLMEGFGRRLSWLR